jgi:hypothetical protein
MARSATSGAFFAARSGAIPRGARPRLAGVEIPSGRRYPRQYAAAYWCTDAPVPDWLTVCRQLVRAFAETGVWPLLWTGADDPDSLLGGHGDIDAVEPVDVAAVFEARWPPGGFASVVGVPFPEFPGLADGAAVTDGGMNPFCTIPPELGESSRLLLVPCNRPADAITQVGGLGSETAPATISAVFRSWEQRFGAVVCAVGPGLALLSASADTSGERQTELLAAELMAFAPGESGSTPGGFAALVAHLRREPDTVSPDPSGLWTISLD